MLLYIAFVILLLAVFFKALRLCIKMTWGLTKILFRLVFCPLALIGLVIGGLIWVALIILVIIGVALFGKKI